MVTQRVRSFRKKIKLTVMNMLSKLLQNHSVYPPLSAGGIEPPTKFSKKKGGGLDRTSTFSGNLLGKRGT